MLGRLQKKSVEHNDCLYPVSVLEKRVTKSPMDNAPSLQNYFRKNCWSAIPMLLKRQICLNVILQTWDLFLHNGLTEHYIFFVTRSMTFFSSDIFVISILVFFLIRTQSSKLTLKTKWYHSYVCCDDSCSFEQLKKRVADKYFENKLDLEPESPSVTGKVCCHYNHWMTGVCRAYMFDRNSRGKISQIE